MTGQSRSRARLTAAVLALVCWGTLALQLYLTLATGHSQGQTMVFTLTNYFSYFTIFINLFAAAMFTWTALTLSGPPQGLASVAAVYIAVGGLGYSLLLRNVWDPQGLQKLADMLLHDIIPVAYVLFWLIVLRKRAALPWRSALVWLIWPLIYLIYSLTRGSIVGWYPYYFLDSRIFSWQRIAATIAVFLAAFLILGFTAIWLTRMTSLNTSPEQEAVSPSELI